MAGGIWVSAIVVDGQLRPHPASRRQDDGITLTDEMLDAGVSAYHEARIFAEDWLDAEEIVEAVYKAMASKRADMGNSDER